MGKISNELVWLVADPLSRLGFRPNVALLLGTVVFILILAAVSWLTQHASVRFLERLSQTVDNKIKHPISGFIKKNKIIPRLSRIAPILLVYSLSDVLITNAFRFTTILVGLLKKGLVIYLIFNIVLAIQGFFNVCESLYETYEISKKRPIKIYLQVLISLSYAAGTILVVANILDVSPMGFFTGLGAATALIVLVFKDTLLGFVSSIQLTAFDIVRINDWITIPSMEIDGNVKEISLAAVKISNFDNTITTVPTYALISNSMQNWRSMQESGARRMKFSIPLDLSSVRFCDEKLEANLKNKDLFHPSTLNTVSPTNVYLFREYAKKYLSGRSDLESNRFPCLVRLLSPTHNHIPLEILAFSRHIQSVAYEETKGSILDHLLATLSEFDLMPHRW